MSKQILQTFARHEDVTALLETYNEYFNGIMDDEAEPPIPEVVDFQSSRNIIQGDFRIEVETTMSLETLEQCLGLQNGSFPSFNTYQHRSGISPWENQEIFQSPMNDNTSSLIDILRLH